MLILTIRTDKPEAELGLFEDQTRLAYFTWPAHRQLAETIHLNIKELLSSYQKDLKDVEAIAAYKGPGSFTGLRIGLSVANALASGLNIPIVAMGKEDWIQEAIAQLMKGQNDKLALPEYGSPPHITQPKH
ncbi:MAG TPA: tRNA (adenosine(37)-N6)-threonylcarbamoyltransferase complex dimerization subunit type 1 TsaB [Candidatus Saccharimonadales bacterium]|nr:tRNA (adenosine(37)-N6)-threonylcarbamoyltransferase complex dimerization subunit type 1 TsaB [Candidatus Saccharimonadales bacterium]